MVATYPNGVNFKIEDESAKQQVVHHNRLSPVRESPNHDNDDSSDDSEPDVTGNDEDGSATDDTSTSGESAGSAGEEVPPRRYPLRERRQRQFPDMVPWDAVDL